MNLDRSYFEFIWRWLWLIILATAIAAGVSYWLSSQHATEYEAKARLLVGPGLNSSNPQLNDLRTSAQLMQTYAEMAKTRPVLEEVVDRLRLDIDPGRVAGRVEAKTNAETLVLTIQVRDQHPDLAVAIANGLADSMVRLPGPAVADVAKAVGEEVSEVEAQIARSTANIQRLEQDRADTVDLDQQKLILDQIDQEQNRLADYHRTLAQLYESLQQTFTNQIQMIEPAIRASKVDSALRLNVIVAALAGMVAAVVIALAFEYFDNGVKSGDQLARILRGSAPVLGTLDSYPSSADQARDRLVTTAQPSSDAAEAYRMLGTRLVLAPADPPRSILVATPDAAGSDEGGEVAANLAIALAEAGKRVLLVDANLQRPTAGLFFDLPDRQGLSEVLSGRIAQATPTAIAWAPGLSVLSSGAPVPDPFKLLSGPRAATLLEALGAEAEVLILAAAPLLAHAEGLYLATRADATLLVVPSGQSRREAVGEALVRLQALGAHLAGAVLSRVPKGSWSLRRGGRGAAGRSPAGAETLGERGTRSADVAPLPGQRAG